MKFDIKHILIFGLALGMTSCVETMKDGDMSTGFLGIPVLDADIQVEEFGATKATPAPTLPTLSVPESSALHFKVTDSKSNVVWNQKGLWRDPLKMPVGSYTIEVTYGPNTYGNPWYTGTCTGTISAVTEAEPATIRLSLCNSLLAVVLADDFAQHFTPSEGNCVTITSTSGSTSTTLGNYVFVPDGEALTIQVAGTSSAGISKTLSWTLKNPLSAATATYVTCSLTTTNAPTITMSEIPVADAWGNTAYVPLARTEHISEANVAKMQYFASSNEWVKSDEGTIVDIDGEKLVKFTGLTPGATYKVRAQLGALKSNEVSMTMSTSALSIKTVAHTKTNNELDGTDFTASFSVDKKFGVTESSLQLCKTDGTVLTVLRTVALNGTSADWTSDGSTLKGPRDWPYLPKGNYILKGTAIQNEVEVHLEEKSITVDDAPTFTVNTPSAHTSYNTYLTSGAAEANKEDGSTIYGIANNGVKISSNILNNDNYKSLIGGYTYFIDEKQVYEVNNANQSWGAHDIVAKYTFNGVTAASNPLTCHVTGLPYTAAPPTNTGAHPWTISRGKEKISFTSEYVEFTTKRTSASDPLIQSPSFQIPADINVFVESSFKLKANEVLFTYNSEIYLWISGEKKYTKTHKSTTEKQYNESIEGIINTSKPYIEIEKNGTTELTGSAKFMSVIVKYR